MTPTERLQQSMDLHDRAATLPRVKSMDGIPDEVDVVVAFPGRGDVNPHDEMRIDGKWWVCWPGFSWEERQ